MNSQDTILTLGMVASTTNCVLPIIEVKVDLDDRPLHFGSLKPPRESTFIDFDDLSDEDGKFSIGSNMIDAYERKTLVSQVCFTRTK